MNYQNFWSEGHAMEVFYLTKLSTAKQYRKSVAREWNTSKRQWWKDKTGTNWRTWKKACPSDNLSDTNPMPTGLE